MSEDRLIRIEAKLDGLVTDVGVLKTDVAVLKTDVAVLKTDVAVLKTDVAVLKTDVAVLKTDVAVLKTSVAGLTTDVSSLQTNMSVLTVKVSGLEVSVSEVRQGMDVMAADIHKLGVLQEAAHSDARVPFESDAGLREHMDRQFELTRREWRDALAPITLTLRAHSEQLRTLANQHPPSGAARRG
jgi:phage shock protein A